MKKNLNHWSCLSWDPFMPPSPLITVTNLSMLVRVVLLLVRVVAVVVVVINKTALFVVKFVVGKGITPLLVETVTPILQMLPTL